MKLLELFENKSEIVSSEDLFAKFVGEVKKHAPTGTRVSFDKKWSGGGWQSRQVTIDVDAGGFAAAVLWRAKEDARSYMYKGTQHDISVNQKGEGLGTKLVDAFVSAFKAIGLNEVSIHLPTNTGFWKKMQSRHNFFSNT